jgi:uncharacterized protein GlcG (DUF336 family)
MHTHRRRSIAGLTGLALSATLATTVLAQTPSLSLGDAKKVLAAAEAAAAKVPVALTCTVVDARADLVAMVRMDGAKYFTVNVAQGKARATASFGGPSGSLSGLAGSGIGGALGDPQHLVIVTLSRV